MPPRNLIVAVFLAAVVMGGPSLSAVADDGPGPIPRLLTDRCLGCHNESERKGGLNLEPFAKGGPARDGIDPAFWSTWIRIHDRVRDRQMPPGEPLSGEERSGFLSSLHSELVAGELQARQATGRATLRRLNRTEYEFTLRDLLGLPALEVRDLLPADGRVQGYDKGGPALEFSTVQIQKHLAAAQKALPLAIAPYPERDETRTVRIYPGDDGGLMDGIINGCGIPLRDFRFDDSLFPLSVPSGNVPAPNGFAYFDRLQREGKIPYRGAIGVMRNEDSWKADLGLISPVVPGLYRVRVSVWGFHWNRGVVEPTTPHIARLVVNGQHSGSTGTVVGSFDAPSFKPTVGETVAWLTPADSLIFQPASVLHDWQGIPWNKMDRYTGDGVALDWLEVEGPLLGDWPELGHRRLFGDLPLVRWVERDGAPRPPRRPIGQWRGGPQAFTLLPRQQETWTVDSANPKEDARRLLADFLPLVFRRPLEPALVDDFATIALARIAEGGLFEDGMLAAYQTALCSPDFLFLKENPVGPLDDYSLASRLSYLLWCSAPDVALLRLAAEGSLSESGVLRAETDRLLTDSKGERFVRDFLDQWLELRLIDENTPHSKLYPEYRPLLRDAMLEEPRAFFRELLQHDLPASNIVRSDFAMLNQPLAEFYGDFDQELFTIPQENPRTPQPRDTLPRPVTSPEPIAGSAWRRVPLSPDSQRGGFLTMAAVLKVTANGTTTSPVRRGAWVARKILGQPPEPPPPNIPAVEPDTRGLTTIRTKLEQHRADPACAACHRHIDPHGFALESYDAIGGFRARYRALEKGDRVTRPPSGAGRHEFLLGLPVDPRGDLADGRSFADIRAYRELLLADERQIARNFVEQLIVYATGSPVSFADRDVVERILDETASTHHGIRSLIHAVVQSEIFRQK